MCELYPLTVLELRTVGMKRGGASITAKAKETKRLRGTIATVLRKFRLSGKARALKRSGRPSLTTERENRCLIRLVKEIAGHLSKR